MKSALEKYTERKTHQEHIEHRDVLLAIAALIKTNEGRTLFQYLFKQFEVNVIPERGIEGIELHDYLGFLRAGNSIYKLACEAAFETAANIAAELERKRYDDKLEFYRIENGIETNADTGAED